MELSSDAALAETRGASRGESARAQDDETPAQALLRLKSRITAQWVRDKLGEHDCTSAVIEDFSGQGGLSCDLFLLHTTHVEAGDAQCASRHLTRVLKTFLGAAQRRKSVQLGLWREGTFFEKIFDDEFSSTQGSKDKQKMLQQLLPKVYYSEGNGQTGDKLILMEKLDGVQTGVFFSPHHPILSTKNQNAKVHLDALRTSLPNMTFPTEFEACATAFRTAAKLHASFWMDRTIVQAWDFLHARDDVLGDSGAGAAAWGVAQNIALEGWTKILDKCVDASTNTSVSGGPVRRMRQELIYDSAVRFDAHLVDCVTSALCKIDFHAYRAKLTDPSNADFYPWSLLHGDFYAGNFFERFSAEGARETKLLDLERIGCGPGPQDLGQYMISSGDPSNRRKYEYELVRTVYYEELVDKLKALSDGDAAHIPSVDQVWREYQLGGAGRCTWFLMFLVPICPPGLCQFFCDQVNAFVTDHFPGEEGAALVSMPRV